MQSSYSHEQLEEALDSLGNGGTDYDSRHIYGYGDPNHKLSMLQTITANTILDYEKIMNDPSSPSEQDILKQAQEFANEHGPILNLQQVIQSQSPRMALAAEFKRASPSKGDIAPNANAGDQAQLYANAGANIVSVLTEKHWFKGSLDDLTQARLATNTLRPAILRKDFVVNTYMIAEAAAAGADTILLIVATLPQFLLKELIDYARSLGMEPLVEVHADSELDVALEAGAKVIGVNNRNLHTFQMDLSTTQHVAQQLQERGLHYHHDLPQKHADYTICALSGMSTALDVDRYRKPGVGMCLIGESLMCAANPSAAVSVCIQTILKNKFIPRHGCKISVATCFQMHQTIHQMVFESKTANVDLMEAAHLNEISLMVDTLMQATSSFEKILEAPVPWTYSRHTFSSLWITTLPFALIGRPYSSNEMVNTCRHNDSILLYVGY